MDYKILFIKKLSCSLILSSLLVFLCAQETESEIITTPETPTSYEITEENNEVVFTQTLSWDKVQYSSGYEVILEQQDENNQWIVIENPSSESDETKFIFKTTANEFEMSLYAGKYRYKVYVLDLLNKIAAESEYFYFEIKKALQPEIKDFSPQTIYLDLENNGEFTIDGLNLLSSEEKEDNTVFYFQSITNEKNKLFCTEILETSEKKAKVQFAIDELNPGEYTLIASNPGGLECELSPLIVKFEKLMDLNVSLGYSPSYYIPLDLLQNYLKPAFLPLGAKAKITFIPLKKAFGYFGAEITGYYNYFMQKEETFDISGNIIPITLNAVYQFPIIKKKLILDTHVGGGISLLSNVYLTYDSGVKSPPQNLIAYTANAGIGLQYYFTNRLHIEAGCDYLLNIITAGMIHMVVPTISIGWQF